jgi:hypothetical protein
MRVTVLEEIVQQVYIEKGSPICLKRSFVGGV